MILRSQLRTDSEEFLSSEITSTIPCGGSSYSSAEMTEVFPLFVEELERIESVGLANMPPTLRS